MKPVLIFKEKDPSGNYLFTEKELEDLIEQVYNAGLIDGKAQSQPICVPQPYISQPSEIKPYWALDPSKWTCGDKNPFDGNVVLCKDPTATSIHSVPNPNITAF